MKRITGVLLFFALILSFAFSQTDFATDSTASETSVTLSAEMQSNKVPLNRPAILTVQIFWEGGLDIIEMGDIEEPVLTNLKIIGSSASNRIMGDVGGKKSVKEIAYKLEPQTLGMAYVEAIALSYVDKTTDKTHHLMTQRIGVEVISPVVEKGAFRIHFVWLLVILISVVFIFIFMFNKKNKQKQQNDEQEDIRIAEEIYLELLKEKVNLSDPDTRQSFADLSKLFRKYLADKYKISTLEATTGELIKLLTDEGLDESLIRKSEKLFGKADVVKFSGQQSTPAELEEAYTTVETILESHLARAKELQKQIDEEKSKKRKKFKKKK